MIRLEHVIVVCAIAAFAAAPQTVAPTAAITVDQVGYLPALPKVAFVVTADASREFLIRRAAGDDVVFRGQLTAPTADADQAISRRSGVVRLNEIAINWNAALVFLLAGLQ